MSFRDWWLNHAPGPLWTLSACKPFSPLCLIDSLAHEWFPQTFGWSSENIDNWPDHKPRLCRIHDHSAERHARRKHPEYVDDDN